MSLMLILLPPYLLIAALAVRRRALGLIEQLRPLLPDPREAERAIGTLRDGWKRVWLPGTLAGLAMGFWNAPLRVAFVESPTPTTDGTIALGQQVRFELHRLERLEPLARSGLLDVLVIAGALALSPLQSLDAEFRWYNYSFALLVAIPASAGLLLWPVSAVQARIRREKRRRLAQLDGRIDAHGRRDDDEAIARLETLLAHRDRIASQRTWLFSTDLVSRVLLYLVIPPLAWAGAALVERFVDRALGG